MLFGSKIWASLGYMISHKTAEAKAASPRQKVRIGCRLDENLSSSGYCLTSFLVSMFKKEHSLLM